MLITATQQKQLSDHIAHWEAKTAAEFVVVIARKSDLYRHVPVLWAALAALLVPLGIYFIDHWQHPFEMLLIQWATFITVTLVGFIPAIHRLLTPGSLKQRRAELVARAQFVENNLHHTQGATGVLIFISEFEHYVEIIADQGVNGAVTSNYWDDLVHQLGTHIKSGKTAAGLMKLIDSLGGTLATHFPAGDDKNELPNNIVILK